MILNEQLTKEQRQVQAEINSTVEVSLSAERYRKSPQEKIALKDAKALWKQASA